MGESAVAPRELGRQESLRLLAGSRYGRVVLTEHALLSVVPVAFRADDSGVVVGDNGDGRLAGLTDGSVVAFQVDHTDAGSGEGWSVVVTGYASTVPDAMEPHGTPDGKAAAVPKGKLVRIDSTIVTGCSFTLPP